jgi:hypothetical protein
MKSALGTSEFRQVHESSILAVNCLDRGNKRSVFWLPGANGAVYNDKMTSAETTMYQFHKMGLYAEIVQPQCQPPTVNQQASSN